VRSKNELTRNGPRDGRRFKKPVLRSAFDAPRSFSLSYGQEQVWFMDGLPPGSPLHHLCLQVPFHGSCDVTSLRRALDALAARHDMLRARFETVEQRPVQIVEPEIAVDLEIEDLSALPEDQRAHVLARALRKAAAAPFDLAATCARYKLFRLDPASHLLSVTLHRLIADDWSLHVFVADLTTAYEGYRRGEPDPDLPALPVAYSDYAQWQRAALRGLRLRDLTDYWTNHLAGAPHILQLPTDRPRPNNQVFRGTLASFVIDDRLSELLIAFSARRRVTLFMVLLTCYYTLLYRHSGQEDLTVGVPVANRRHPGLESVIGRFVNTLLLRVRLRHTQTLAELVAEVQRITLGAFEHQALPLARLVAELDVEPVPGYPPLYQEVFNFQNISLIESAGPGVKPGTMAHGDWPPVHASTAKVDLYLTIVRNGSRLTGGLEYNAALFDRETIDDLISHFQAIADWLVRDPSLSLIAIPLDPAAEAAHAGAGIRRAETAAFGHLVPRIDFEAFTP